MKRSLLLLVLVFLGYSTQARAQKEVDLSQSQMPSVVTVPPEAQASDHFSADAATEAYLAEIPASARARSDAYFEGGYWLILWDFLMSVVILWATLRFGWSAKMRDCANRISRFRFLQDWIYWVQFLILTTLLGAPLAIYEGYFREHKYGLANQTFGPWLGDQLKDLGVNLVMVGFLIALLFWIVRKLPTTWHLWGAGVTIAFFIFGIMIAPVFIFPLFNTFKRLEDPKVTAPILSMARANGIPAHDVFEVDASRQSTRMSANVSGFGKTMRITLNDNLLHRGSPEEIKAVMGHEMGHYVLNHIPKDILFFSVVFVIFFAILRWGVVWALGRYGEGWRVREITDPAVLPLAMLIITVFFFVLTPIVNTHIRTNEHEADMFGINASRQPDGMAQAAIHLGEYRKMSPGPVEEWIFYDHPSGRRRIHDAMQWKAQNLVLFQQ
ncbi:MAG TPA: M48 family metallopeptidase [Dongiaceae bacterium]|nr:M48 family metallopeptidase [Dongiaceae bacterium]